MPTTQKGQVLVQTKVPRDLYKALVEKMKGAGDISLAAYVRRVLHDHVQEVADGKK